MIGLKKRIYYYHNVSFNENMNSGNNSTKYYALTGVPLILKEYNYQNPVHYFYFDVPEWWDRPNENEDYDDQAGDIAVDYISEYYPRLNVTEVMQGNDGWVTTNSGIGYKNRKTKSDLQIDMTDRILYFGPKEKVGHSNIYDRTYVQEQIVLWLREK